MIDTLLAATPLVLILILMVGLKWSGAKAGAAGWAAALLIAVLRFSASGSFLLWSQALGLAQALYVLYIIWGALLFFRITEADGTLSHVAALLQKLSPDRGLQVLLLAWGFTSFLQGVGGYGVPVAVAAPILVSMGFPTLAAVVMSSLGHTWSISFGSLGASYEALLTSSGIPSPVLTPWMAMVLAVVCFEAGFAVLWIAGGKQTVRSALGPMLAMAVAMSGVQYLAAVIGIGHIAAMLGAMAGLLVGGIWARATAARDPQGEGSTVVDTLRLLAPYIALILIILAASFIPALDQVLDQVTVQIAVPALTRGDGTVLAATRTKALSVFGHPGALLVYAAGFSWVLAKLQKRLPSGSGKKILKGVAQSGLKSSLGILTMVGMAATMETTGMVTQLSEAMAQLAGQLYPAVAPFVGALGAFMTGSNTNANVIFGAFQRQVAEALGYPAAIIAAVHNAGAAVGSVFAPAKVIVSCSTVGLSGKESEAMKQITRYCLVCIGSIAVLAVGYLALVR